MKKILYVLAAAFSLMNLTACMDDWDEPNTDNFIITSPTSVGEVNTTIGEIKDLYCAGKTGKIVNDYNYWTEITEDKVLEGVIVANDCGGNLYQTLLVRKIDESLSDVQNRDQAIILSIRHTWLTPYFPVGQRIKINLKGLYVGCNSGEAKIGQPYYTSSGNFRLGPALLDMCKTNIELVGKADPTLAECKPVLRDPSWLRATANRTYKYSPQLASVVGRLEAMDPANKDVAEAKSGTNYLTPDVLEPLPKIFAPEAHADKGYGVDRILLNNENNTKVYVRTSTQNDIAFTLLPEGYWSYTGILSVNTYDNVWQIQLRSLDDLQEAE